MSEQEFETYLKLLGRLLRLSESQRAEIAEEFRAHFDQRVEDLVEQGSDSETAIRTALRDFGDASALAQELTRISRQRKRRLIMKTSIGSIAACAAIVFFAPQLLPVAAVQQGGQEAAPQEVAEAEDGGTPDSDEANEDDAASDEASDNPWKQFVKNNEIEVIDIAKKMDYADAEVSRRRAAELAETVRQVIPFQGEIRASAADGLLIVVGDESIRMLARDIANRLIRAWIERDREHSFMARRHREERTKKLIIRRNEIEEQLLEAHEELVAAENMPLMQSFFKNQRIQALKDSLEGVNDELAKSGLED